MKKWTILLAIVLSVFSSVTLTHSAEVQLNEKLGNNNMEILVISVENTGKQEWFEASFFPEPVEVMDNNLCFWKLQLKITSKKPLRFSSERIKVIYYEKYEKTATTQSIVGLVDSGSLFGDVAMFGPVNLKNDTKGPPDTVTFSASVLFLAPEITELIEKMEIDFLDFSKVKVPLDKL